MEHTPRAPALAFAGGTPDHRAVYTRLTVARAAGVATQNLGSRPETGPAKGGRTTVEELPDQVNELATSTT